MADAKKEGGGSMVVSVIGDIVVWASLFWLAISQSPVLAYALMIPYVASHVYDIGLQYKEIK